MQKAPATSESSGEAVSQTGNGQATCPKCLHEFDPNGRDQANLGQHAPTQDEPVSLAVDHDSPTLTEKAQQPHGSPLATIVRWVLLAAVLLGVMTAIVVLVIASKDDSDPSGQPSAAHRKAGLSSASRPDGVADGATSDPVLQAIERSIVRIETGGPSGTVSLGSGFVVDASGLVATNYHVVSEATMGQVRFRNGTTYEIEGYAAVAPEHDLAVIRLSKPPKNLLPLALRTQGDPARKSEVFAVGHPDGVGFSLFNGKVSQVLETSQLSDRSQFFLQQHLQNGDQHRWIQHTAALTEGNSGGPLLDRQGRVIGINTWVNKETGFGYALHADYLVDVLESRLEAVAPLEQYSTEEVRVAAALQRLSVERINRLYKEAKEMRWAPRNRLDYQTLQQLALAVTKTRLRATSGGSNTIRSELLESLIQAVDAIELDIEQHSLQIIEQLTLLNEFAATELLDVSEGLIFVATVENEFEGPSGTRGMLARLAGHDRRVFVPLNSVFLTPKAGAHYLVIGFNSGQVVRFGENPLDLEIAPVVVSRTIVPLGP